MMPAFRKTIINDFANPKLVKNACYKPKMVQSRHLYFRHALPYPKCRRTPY